jgi:hypothetical protein
MGQSADPVCLAQDTLVAFAEYVEQAETAIDRGEASVGEFLWCDTDSTIVQSLHEGKTVTEHLSGKQTIQVTQGLIHDWIGTTFARGASVDSVIAVVQDYNNHKNFYKPEVVKSALINRTGNDFEIYLRLFKKKIVTVVLDTYHDVHYSPLDPKRWCIRSRTTRISEVSNAGKPDEAVTPPDVGYGYLWRLNSYWRFFERDKGTYIECRTISLTRDVPKGLGWVIGPIVKKLPRQSLAATLDSTRSALTGPPVDAPDSQATDADGTNEDVSGGEAPTAADSDRAAAATERGPASPGPLDC